MSLSKAELLLELAGCCKDKVTNTQRCRSALSRLIQLLSGGEVFTADELDEAFLIVSRLFQASDPGLKRMVLLAMESLQTAPSFCMATNSINKEANSPSEPIKAAAIRLLPLTAEQQAPAHLERQLKLALAQKNPKIVLAALCAIGDLSRSSPETLKKCSDELLQLIQGSREPGIAANALILLAAARKEDTAGLIQVYAKAIANNSNFCDLGQIYLSRMVSEFLSRPKLRKTLDAKTRDSFINFLIDVAERSADTPALEAIKGLALCDAVESRKLRPVMSRVGLLLNSSGDAGKLAALRAVSILMKNPLRSGLLGELTELSDLTKSSNRPLAAMAISIMLKSVEGERAKELLGLLFNLLEELPGASREEALRDCEALVKRTPALAPAAMKFLWDALREKKGPGLKMAALETMSRIAEFDKASEPVLIEHLCECIEDSPSEEITLHTLQILAQGMRNPGNHAQTLKHLANRLTLDSAVVRAATVTCLGIAGLESPVVRPKALELLRPLADSAEDEVRQRSLHYSQKLQEQASEDAEELFEQLDPKHLESAIAILESAEDPASVDLSKLWTQAAETSTADKTTKKEKTDKPSPLNDFFSTKEEFAGLNLGTLCIEGDAFNLNEPDAEVFISARKLIFGSHFGLEFSVQNNLEFPITRFTVKLANEGNISLLKFVSQDSIASGASGKLYFFFKTVGNYLQGSISGSLKFIVATSSTSSYDDELQIDPIEVGLADFLAPSNLATREQFDEAWDAMKTQESAPESYELDECHTVAEAAAKVEGHYKLTPCADGSEKAATNVMTYCFAGNYLASTPVLIRTKIGLDPKKKTAIVVLTAKSANSKLTNDLVEF